MTIIIPQDFQNFLKSNYKYITAFNNIKDIDNDTKKSLFLIKSKLSGYNKNKDLLLYITINLFRKISTTYADYIMGSGISVSFSDDKTTEDVIKTIDEKEINTKLYDQIVKSSTVGYSVIRIINNNPDIRFQKIPSSNYFAETNGLEVGSNRDDIITHYIVTVEKVKEGEETKRYAHIDSYRKEGNKRKLSCDKYIYKDGFTFKDENFIENKKKEVLDYLPIFILQNDIINDEETTYKLDAKEDSNGMGFCRSFFAVSDYIDIFDIIQDINDRTSQVSVELIKNLGSKMSLPASYIETQQKQKTLGVAQANLLAKEKGVEQYISSRFKETDSNLSENFDRIVHGPSEQPAHYIQKDNPMIDKAYEAITKNIRFLSAITSIPVTLLAIEEKSGNRFVGTDDNEFEAFYERIEKKRSRLYPVLQKIFAYIVYCKTGSYPKELPTIKFPRLKSRGTKDKVTYLSQMYNDSVLSKESYIGLALNYDSAETDEEIQKIDSGMKTESEIRGTILPSLAK